MDYGGRYSGSNAIEIIPDESATGGSEAWMPPSDDQSIWATEDEYRAWNTEPPSEETGGSSQNDAQASGSSSKSKAIGKTTYKTKLCCKFRVGTCPYITNCNFAHGMEELRPPPRNRQQTVAAQDEASEEPREEHQIPILISSTLVGEGQRSSYRGKHCKKFYTEEGCPYGDACTFLHDEQSKARESVAISLSPTVGGGGGGYGAGGAGLKPSNWKTRMCNKWEMTGYCPFGSNCHFAHGAAELHRYGGGLVDMDGRDAAAAAASADSTRQASRADDTDVVAAASNTTWGVPQPDILHLPAQGTAAVSQRPRKWKGPDKISKIYGDWIDDLD